MGSLSSQETIGLLLEHWQTITDPQTSPLDSPGDGDGTPHMPRLYHHPVIRELERALRELRETRRPEYVAVRTHYDAPTRIIRATRQRRQHGKLVTIRDDHTVRILPAGHDPSLVTAGIRSLTGLYRGRPQIPDELWQALTRPYAA